MDELLIFFIIILTVFLLIGRVKRSEEVDIKISQIDGRKYIVRKQKDSQLAADRLAQVNQNVLKLIESLNSTERDGIDDLKNKYNPDALSETGHDAEYTSYSVNKGEKISLCIRSKDDSLSDMNTTMFVMIHELAHVMTPEVGHTKLFWDNMKYLLEQGEKIGVYTPINYKDTPQNYCGMEINTTPYKFN
tara:strand:+ start:3030 stop:3599 length:570 start_codon:yes stop_codon:yes gene_type:complete